MLTGQLTESPWGGNSGAGEECISLSITKLFIRQGVVEVTSMGDKLVIVVTPPTSD